MKSKVTKNHIPTLHHTTHGYGHRIFCKKINNPKIGQNTLGDH
jgi:hypothetical protein